MQTLFFRCCYSTSSKGWIQRQARDPYVKAAKANQYRARSAFKLLQLDSKYKLLKKGHVVIDCGAAPGGWTQVIARKVRDTGLVVAVDLLPIDPIPNAHIIKGDFMDAKVQSKIQTTLQQRPVNLVCSDMAPSFTGNHFADHARSMELCESALMFAESVLAPGGAFVAKVIMGGDEVQFRQKLRTMFHQVKQEKPDASRKKSTEVFVVATGFKKNDQLKESSEDTNSGKS
ncbi:hypothetical protein VTP01DRAFT_8052 [Rhizomucor pusillus]|uniref:uncharacterized protein n=1 Tax=Rhizomucor pusillus TaxID=4840 RepID=UPI0037432C54